MAIFAKAPLDTVNGAQTLPPGKYFIDTDEAKIFKDSLWITGFFQDVLDEEFPKDAITEVVRSGRGQVMIAFNITKEITVPNEVLQQTGFFYVMPPGMTLNAVQDKLYGSIFNETQGFWEWLSTNHPDIFRATEKSFETTVAITNPVNALTKNILYVGGAVVIVLVLAKLVNRKGS